MLKKVILGIALSLITSVLFVGSVSANTLCNDGTISPSTGKGTCSWHGGIAGGQKKSYRSPSTPSDFYKNQLRNNHELPPIRNNLPRGNSFNNNNDWNSPSYGSNSRRGNSFNNDSWSTNSWRW